MSPVLLTGASDSRGVVWCESRFEVLGLGFSWEWRSSPQKGSCIWDLTAQASGQALIRSSESSGSASCSVFPSVRHPATLSFSTLLHLCVYLQSADLSVPSLLRLRICSIPQTIRGRCLPSLSPPQNMAVFIRWIPSWLVMHLNKHFMCVCLGVWDDKLLS